jgi:uncharacterized membrane protein
MFPPTGPGMPQQRPPMKPDSNLVWAILATVLCCLPFGIVAILAATKVDTLYAQGQYAAAEQASADARKWSIVAAAASLIATALYFGFIVVVALLGGGTTTTTY